MSERQYHRNLDITCPNIIARWQSRFEPQNQWNASASYTNQRKITMPADKSRHTWTAGMCSCHEEAMVLQRRNDPCDFSRFQKTQKAPHQQFRYYWRILHKRPVISSNRENRFSLQIRTVSQFPVHDQSLKSPTSAIICTDCRNSLFGTLKWTVCSNSANRNSRLKQKNIQIKCIIHHLPIKTP